MRATPPESYICPPAPLPSCIANQLDYTKPAHDADMSRALAIAAVLLLAAAAVAPLADAASSAESIPFAKEIAGGASAVQDAGAQGVAAMTGAGQAAAQMVDPDPASALKADPSPARR
jgi:hypothetical protein